ncbi:MAG: antibiotic biosynthesis monooxygenase [Candidatus Omnitrophica bacterium]|nr:antibiotic biosynthesis monooxygenase [Candidatus Omnitrophota bacterium]
MNENAPETNSPDELVQGATGVITHHVHEGKHDLYEAWLKQIVPVCRSYPGHLDLQVIRPVPSLTTTYTVVIRFDTVEHLRNWVTSDDRKSFIEKVQPILQKDDHVHIRSGLDFLFTQEGSGAKVPTRWKQALLTWSALFPVGLMVRWAMLPVFNQLGLTEHDHLKVFINSGITIVIMVYLVMPHYTKLVQKWLFD